MLIFLLPHHFNGLYSSRGCALWCCYSLQTVFQFVSEAGTSAGRMCRFECWVQWVSSGYLVLSSSSQWWLCGFGLGLTAATCHAIKHLCSLETHVKQKFVAWRVMQSLKPLNFTAEATGPFFSVTYVTNKLENKNDPNIQKMRLFL